jgi:hypothetical protein
VEVNEHWVYHAHSYDEVSEVVVIAIGTKRPARVKVAFVADEFEGRADWVPPSRLKTLWADRSTYTGHIARWGRLFAAGSAISSSNRRASEYVLDLIPGHPAFPLSSSREMRNTVTEVSDWSAVQAVTGISRDEIWSPLAITENDRDYLPWPAALVLALAYAERHSPAVLRELAEESEALEREEARDRNMRASQRSDKVTRRRDEMRGVISTVRGWRGEGSAGAAEELEDLRRSLADLIAIIEREVLLLIEKERTDLAWDLYSRLYPNADKQPWREVLKLERRAVQLEPAILPNETRTVINERREARAALIGHLGISRFLAVP